MSCQSIQLAVVMVSAIALSGFLSEKAIAQSSAPESITKSKTAEQHVQHRRGPKQLAISNADGAIVTLWKPDLSKRVLQSKMGMITIPPTGVDNYHAIVVERDWGSLKEAIIRYEYLRGKPSGQSPTRLTSAEKTEFEIVPDPIPREHHRYYSGQDWSFILRYKDKPISNHPVVLQTSYGSLIEAVSDSEGKVTFRLPDDFPEVVKGERDKRNAEINVSSEFSNLDLHYQTTLTAEYQLSPKHWQSKPLGIAVAGLGFILGGFVTHLGSRGKKGGGR